MPTIRPVTIRPATIRPKLTDLRTATARRRALRTEQRRLERELAEYRTSAERHELAAILSRHPAEATEPIERILLRQTRPGGLVHQG